VYPYAAAGLAAAKKRKEHENFALFSNHNRSLLRWQPGAMIIGHSPAYRSTCLISKFERNFCCSLLALPSGY